MKKKYPAGYSVSHYQAPIRRMAIFNFAAGIPFTLLGLFLFYASYLMNGFPVFLVTPAAWIALVIGVACLFSGIEAYLWSPDPPTQWGAYDSDKARAVAKSWAESAPPYSGSLSDLDGLYGSSMPGNVVVAYTRGLSQFSGRTRVCVTAGVDRNGGRVLLQYHLEDFGLVDRDGSGAAADDVLSQQP